MITVIKVDKGYIPPRHAISWFEENRVAFDALRNGSEVDVPEDVYNLISNGVKKVSSGIESAFSKTKKEKKKEATETIEASN